MIKDKKIIPKNINLILLRKIGLPEYKKQFSSKKIKIFLERELIN